MEGVHATSAKAYFRHITDIDKPEKQDIYDKICLLYFDDKEKVLNFDVSDSIAVALTLINSKWNKDLDERIKELKKDLKKFKSDKKLSEINEQINKLKEKGFSVYAAHLKGDKTYREIEYSDKSIILIGNEGNGLSDEISELADVLVKIPMKGRVESLNAAVAAALMMFECQ